MGASQKISLIIDANIFFSALITKGITAEIISSGCVELFTPAFLIKELLKHSVMLFNKTKRTNKEIENILRFINVFVKVVSIDEYKHCVPFAQKISPDENDAPYFALALHLHCPIWSNDKKLKEQNLIKVYSTEEIVKIINDNFTFFS